MSQPTPAPVPSPAVIVPASARLDALAPIWQGLRRIVLPLIALAPFLWDAVYQAVSSGQLHIPDQYATLWAALVLAVQLYNKARAEQHRQQDAGVLEEHRLPVNRPIAPASLALVLHTSATLQSLPADAPGVALHQAVGPPTAPVTPPVPPTVVQ